MLIGLLLCRTVSGRPHSSILRSRLVGVITRRLVNIRMAGKMELFVKAGKDGKTLGDCPFSQLAYMVACHKNIPVTLVMVDLAKKSEEFLKVSAPNHSVPVLRDGETIVNGSGEIAQYFQTNVPEPDMSDTTGGKAPDVISALFGKFAAMMKNKDVSKEEEFRLALNAELQSINSYLASSPGPFLGGDHLAITDCALAPRLFHIRVAGKAWKDFTISLTLESLERYIATVFATDAFQKSSCRNEEVVHGWSKFFP